MDIHKLWDQAKYFSEQGYTISSEHIALLQNSLTLLQNDNHFAYMYYWGQILGVDHDYFIAYGFQKDALRDRTFFYSTNLNDWNLLSRAKKKWKKLALLTTSRFQGDPTIKISIVDESLEDKDPDRINELKEENRLAAIVSLISEECEIVARGQLIKLPDGQIIVNYNFYGLKNLEAKELKSYLHYRPPQQRWNKNLLTRADYNYSMDFFDSIDTDIPNGCWVHTFGNGGTIVFLKCLYWPGMLYFHKIKTGDAGFTYVGPGHKNLDVPFII